MQYDDQPWTTFDSATTWTRDADGAWHGSPGPDWLQGRTAFSGYSAAVAKSADARRPTRERRALGVAGPAVVRGSCSRA